MGKTGLLNLLTAAARLDHMLVSVPFLLAPRRPYLSSVCPRFMCVHAKAKTRKPIDKQWKESEKSIIKRHKADTHDRHSKHSMNGRKQAKEIANKQDELTSKTTNKQGRKQTKGGVRKGQMSVWIGCP